VPVYQLHESEASRLGDLEEGDCRERSKYHQLNQNSLMLKLFAFCTRAVDLAKQSAVAITNTVGIGVAEGVDTTPG
jgi:hypothetical protein